MIVGATFFIFLLGMTALGLLGYDLVHLAKAVKSKNRMRILCRRTMEGKMTEFEKLIGLAQIARATYERIAIKSGFGPDLGGMCYYASNFLRKLAKAHGIPTEIGRGMGHWFVIYIHDGVDMVVDITATQFDVKDRVAVLPLTDAVKRGAWWELREREDSPTDDAWAKASVDEEKTMEEIFRAGRTVSWWR